MPEVRSAMAYLEWEEKGTGNMKAEKYLPNFSDQVTEHGISKIHLTVLPSGALLIVDIKTYFETITRKCLKRRAAQQAVLERACKTFT